MTEIVVVGYTEISREKLTGSTCQKCGETFTEEERVFDVLKREGEMEWEEELCEQCLNKVI